MMSRKLWPWAVAAVIVGAHASTPNRVEAPSLRTIEPGPDLVPDADAMARRLASPVQPNAAGPTREEVGDADSFGRNVTWLGLAQMNITLSSDPCPADPGPDSACQQLAPWPSQTSFDFDDVARISLPGKASKSILCHWFSPYLSLEWGNPGSGPVLGNLYYQPTLTIESPVLDDPSLVNPQTGMPFLGRLETGMSATENIVVPLDAGASYYETRRDTATCIAGFLTRRGLVDNYGLSEAQAKEVLKKPMVIRMNIRGRATHLGGMQAYFGLRVMGD